MALPMNSMSRSVFVLFAATFLLTACEKTETIGTIQNFGVTASGALQEAKGQVDDIMQMGKSVTEGVTEMIEDTKRRIDQVQSGVDLMMQGKDMVEGGVKGE